MPSVPSLGFIHSTLKLERAPHIYYGSGDVVKGSVVLEYRPPKTSHVDEIFGPLQVDIILKGTLKVKSYDDDEHKRRCECPGCQRRTNEKTLCRITTSLWSGPARLQPSMPVEYSFATEFPQNPDENVSTHFAAEPLPPSAKASTLVKSEGLAEATYQIAAQVEMHGLDVRVVSRGGPYEIQFEQPGYPPHRDTGTRDNVSNHRVRSKYLLPETQRSRGLKALFAKKEEFPEFVFSVAITGFPRSISADQGFVFQVTVMPDLEASTCMSIPEITLKRCNISLRTATGVQSRSVDERGMSHEGYRTKVQLLPCQVSPEGPFIIKNSDDKGDEISQSSTKAISILPLDGIGSTLSLHNLVRRYYVMVRLEMMVADQPVIAVLKRSELSVHSPPAPQIIERGMVHPVIDSEPVNPEFPRYNSLGSSDHPPPQYGE